jgi:hypothetical protein
LNRTPVVGIGSGYVTTMELDDESAGQETDDGYTRLVRLVDHHGDA